MVQANVLTDHSIEKHEQHLIHVYLEVPEYDRTSGQKLSEPYLQKFSVQDFQAHEKIGGFGGYKVTWVHDPSKGAVVVDAQKAADYVPGSQVEPESIVNQPTKPSIPVAQPADQTQGSTMWKYGNKTQLTEKYTEVFGEAPDEALTKDQLVLSIETELEAIEFEKSQSGAK